jgi:hypothetical protein
VPANVTSTDPPAALPAADRAALIATVQRNCDLADAHHADGKSLCTYLLGMREYFRWETGLPPGQAPERARLSGWIAERESRWELLRDEGAGFAPLPLADPVDPFDDTTINDRVAADGLAYGAGIGLFGAPLFFLAECRASELRDGARVIVAGAELARGFTAPPAASRGGTVIVRLDAMRRWLWTRLEASRRGPPGQAFAAALRAYGDPDDPATVERMVEGETETLVLHELGELQVAALLGPDWEAMLAGIDDRRTELLLRAVRDLLADCTVTLPRLIERRADASLLFWLGNFDGLRRAIAPDLAAAFAPRAARVDHAAIDRAARVGHKAWRAVAEDLLSTWRRDGGAALRARAVALAPGGPAGATSAPVAAG